MFSLHKRSNQIVLFALFSKIQHIQHNKKDSNSHKQLRNKTNNKILLQYSWFYGNKIQFIPRSPTTCIVSNNERENYTHRIQIRRKIVIIETHNKNLKSEKKAHGHKMLEILLSIR